MPEIAELLSYNPETGILHWKVDTGRHGRVKAGSIAGCYDGKGYRMLGISGKLFKAHRIAWFLTYGTWPAAGIDHINGIKDDNRLSNLREATQAQNMANTGKRSNNKSGFKGVHWRPADRKYQATIQRHRKQINLGLFNTAEDAHAAYCVAATKLHGEFARTT